MLLREFWRIPRLPGEAINRSTAVIIAIELQIPLDIAYAEPPSPEVVFTAASYGRTQSAEDDASDAS